MWQRDTGRMGSSRSPRRESVQKRKLALVADDDAGIRELVALYLEDLNCDVLEARDGQEALDAALEDEPDLIVVDASIPRLSGYDVTREVRRRLPARVRVLLMSKSVRSGDMADAFEAGADAYLRKPFTPEEFDEQVQVLLVSV
jgi:two-component system, OmpR family, response regulator ResD